MDGTKQVAHTGGSPLYLSALAAVIWPTEHTVPKSVVELDVTDTINSHTSVNGLIKYFLEYVNLKCN